MHTPEIVIKPKKTLSLDDVRELWEYRELLYFFCWRDIKVRYKQTAIGAAWAIFQPFITMVVFTVFFGKLAKIPSDGIPYPLYVYTGLLFWNLFSSAVSETSNSLVANQSILTKTYLPRLIIPLSATVTKLLDFFFAAFILAGLTAYYHYAPGVELLVIFPIALLLILCLSMGIGLFLAAFNVKYRDVRYILPFFIQLLLFVTPVIYPASIAGRYSWILAANPLTGILKAVQATMFQNAPINWPLLGISAVTSLVVLFIGLIYFKKTERYFADII